MRVTSPATVARNAPLATKLRGLRRWNDPTNRLYALHRIHDRDHPDGLCSRAFRIGIGEMEKSTLPAELRQLEVISRESFFAALGPLNVHPTPVGRWSDEWGYRSDWKTPEGRVLGVTIGGTTTRQRIYLATPDFPA